MKLGRVALFAGAVVAPLFLLALAGWFFAADKPSVVVIRNNGDRTAQVSVEMANPGQFAWSGTLEPGDLVVRPASFSDNSFEVECRDSDGVFPYRDGYVTNGMSFAVTITVDGCDNVRLRLETLP